MDKEAIGRLFIFPGLIQVMLPRASDFYQRQEFHFDFGGGQSLTFTNLGKVFYPRTGFTKADILEYYLDVADYLLPHLQERPLTLKRYPDGVEGEFFYEKRCPEYRPEWLKTAAVKAGKEKERQISYCVVSDLASLLWVVNIGDLELHTTLYTTRSEGSPTSMVFDLDPGEPADIISCADVALLLKGLFDDLLLWIGSRLNRRDRAGCDFLKKRWSRQHLDAQILNFFFGGFISFH